MNIIGKYENIVAKRPKIFLVVLIVITLFLAPNVAQFEFDAGDEDFQPDTEIAKANSMIREEYGEEGVQVNIISDASGNVLSLENLLMQVDLEENLNESDVVGERMRATTEAPYGVFSPARLIAQARFIDRAMEEAPIGQDETVEQYSYSLSNAEYDFEEMIRRELTEKANTLSVEEMRTILKGDGDITLEIEDMPFPIVIEFEEEFSPDEVTEYDDEFFPLQDILTFLLSEDYDGESSASKSISSVFIIDGLNDDEILETEKEIQSIAQDTEDENTRLRVIGDALIDEEVNEASGANIGLLMPLAFIFVIVVLGIMYRNFTDTILNLTALIMAVIWVYGIGVLVGFNLGNPMMTTVPVLIIGLGIDYGIHFTSRYREEIREGKEVGEAMSRTGATVGFAILLTTVTTVVGFMSNIISNISIIRQFGLLCALGIISAFILMLTFYPSAKTLIDGWKKKRDKELVKKRSSKRKKKRTYGQKFWDKIGEPESFCEADRDCVNNGLGLGAIAARTPVKVIVVVLLITSVGAYGGYQIEAEYSFTDFLPEGLEVTENLNMFVSEFNFSEETVYILVEGDVSDPDVLRNVREARDKAMQSEYAVPARNSETVYNIGEEMFADGTFEEEGVEENWIRITEDEADHNDVIAVYEVMNERRPEDTRRVLREKEGEYTGTLLRIPVDTQEEQKVEETQQDIESAAGVFDENDLDRVLVTGGPIVSQSIFESINEGQIQTLAITFTIALLILAGLYFYLGKGLLLGAVTILPLVFVIIWTFGSMYFLGIPLNPVTVTIAAITVGIGIDFSIHLTQRFNEDTRNIPHPECAICVSASHTGSALFGSAATTIAGFGILSFAVIPPLAQFGQVSALAIFFAFLAAVFVSPTFLLLWHKYKYGDQ